jgi:hypothetical protein
MSKRLLILVITGLLLLLAVPILQAGCGCSGEIDNVNVRFSCKELNISWSHSSGTGSAILVVNYDTLEIVEQSVFTSPSGSISVNFDPPFPKSQELSFLIIVVDNADFYVHEEDIDCTNPGATWTCADGRLTFTLCQPLVIYPVVSEDGVGLTMYLVPRDSEGAGEFMLYIPAEIFDELPDEVAENCTIDRSENGQVVAYLLSSGQYQVNAGPDEEGKVFAYIFNDLASPPVKIDTYIGGQPPDILPSCI